jgi:exonuclease SbcC
MRPVLLEMDGFASFRTHTRVAFDDADYFVLVGATGSGKSTIIDAITFALYGSVPRWDKENVVAPALAPSVTRGTVKLVFDAKGARYVAMREVRRNGSTGQVSVRTARLEKLTDPQALGLSTDETESLGAGKEAKDAVEALLGLDFNQFTKCVALPQGDLTFRTSRAAYLGDYVSCR